MMKERRAITAYNKEKKAQEQERTRGEREELKLSREANKQLQQEDRQADKGRRKTTRSINIDNHEIVVEEVEKVPAPINSRGRQINLPSRFRT